MKNVLINEFITTPKMNIPAASTCNANAEILNTVNIAKISAVTTKDMTTVIIIKPK